MSSELGGRGDKAGNTYENRFLASHLIGLIREEAVSIEVEPLGDEGVGVEFVEIKANGDREYYQCKVSNGENVYWRPSQLNGYSVFQNAKAHIKRGNRHNYHFVSPVAYNELDSLCERARTCDDVKNFTDHQLTNRSLRTWWEKCCILFNENENNTFFLLQRCFFEQIPDSREQTRKLEQLLSLIFVEETEGQASAILVALENSINENKKWGQPLAATDIVNLLKNQGFELRIQENDRRYLPKVHEINGIYQDNYFPIGNKIFPREETKTIFEGINSGESVLLFGKAGAGKSGCIRELTEKLAETGILYLTLALDKYCPERFPDMYGKSLGFPDSPVFCMHRLSGGKPVVIIFDQLDSLRWMNRAAAGALDVCKQMIRQADHLNKYEGGQISLVFAVRKFDYETDPGIRGLFNKQDDSEIEWTKTEVGLLSEETVQAIVGVSYDALSAKLRDILRTPSSLYVWMGLDDRNKNQISSLRQLIEKWWQEVREKCRTCGVDGERIDRCRDKLVSVMRRREQLVLPYGVVADYSREVDLLASFGVLSKTDERISFTHQSFFDYFTVYKWVDEIYTEGRHLPDFYPDKDKQTPDTRYQLLMLLQYMMATDTYTFLDECKCLLQSDNIHYYFQCCAFDVLGQMESPDTTVWKLLMEYLSVEMWRVYVLRMVFFAHPVFVRMLFEKDDTFAWWEDEGCILLRSVAEIDTDLTLDIIKKCGPERFEDKELYDILSTDVNCKSLKGYELRLRLARSNIGLLQNDHVLYRMIEKGIPQSVDLIKIIIEADQNVRKGIHIPDGKAMRRFAENNAELIVNKLAEPMLEKAASETIKTYPWKNPWRNHGYREGIERDLVSLVQTALSWLAKERPEYFLSYISKERAKTPLYTELTLHAIEKMAVSYANDVIEWLISDFDGNAFEKTSGEKTELAVCQRVIERFSPYCSEQLFEELEGVICRWSPDKETIRRTLEYRLQLRKEGIFGAYFPSFWGDLQYTLLPSLDRSRLSGRSSELLAVLKRKFPDGTSKFDISRIESAHFIVSPIENHLDKLSDKSWLNIAGSIQKNPKEWHIKNWRQGTESSPRMFASSLYSAAKKEPVRFAKLSLMFPDKTYEGFKESIVRACESTDVPLELVCEVIRKFCRQPSRELAIAFAGVVEKRASEDWPEDIVQALIDIALNHPDPEESTIPAHSSDLTDDTDCSGLWQGSFNCARGYAIHAITQLVWEHSDLSSVFKDVLMASVNDANHSVLFSSTGLVHAWYNIDSNLSKMLFCKLIKHESRVLFTQEAIDLMCLAYDDDRIGYRKILMDAVNSPVPDLGPEVIKVVTVLAARDESMMTSLLSLPLDQKKADAISREAVLALETEQYRSFGKRILIYLLDNGFTGVASSLLYKKRVDLKEDRDLLEKLILCVDAFVSNQALEYLCEIDGCITEYVGLLLTFIKKRWTSSLYFFEMKYVVKCIARAFQQGKEDINIRQLCLDVWDGLFMRFPLEMTAFSEKLDQ